MDDTLELREQLARAWRTTLEAAIDRGTPPQAVIETMAAVAHARFAESFGPAAAASYLQLLAEQLRDIERQETRDLVRGDEAEAPPQATPFEFALDPNWLVRDDLLG
ncbi:hypothetical protein [Methylobacterium sp. A54F]